MNLQRLTLLPRVRLYSFGSIRAPRRRNDCEGGAQRLKRETFDKRLKWPCEHAISHAEIVTYVTRLVNTYDRSIELCYSVLLG